LLRLAEREALRREERAAERRIIAANGGGPQKLDSVLPSNFDVSAWFKAISVEVVFQLL
jgi:hypothetical protein